MVEDFDKLFKKTPKKITKEEKKAERKARALGEGEEYIYISCPCCGFNRILEKIGASSHYTGKKSGRVSFSSFDFDGSKGKFFIQVRKNAGGRGGGFHLDRSQSITWEEAKKMPEYKEIFDEIKIQANRILKELE